MPKTGATTTPPSRPKDQLDGSGTDSWCLGSQYWTTHLLPAGYKAEYGVLLDMVGAKNGNFTREEISRTNARTALDKIWNTAAAAGLLRLLPLPGHRRHHRRPRVHQPGRHPHPRHLPLQLAHATTSPPTTTPPPTT